MEIKKIIESLDETKKMIAQTILNETDSLELQLALSKIKDRINEIKKEDLSKGWF